MTDRPFLKLWLLYVAVGSTAWSSLAGVGLLLALAFLGDSSPDLATYAASVAQVVLVLFVYPIGFLMVLAAPLAAVHLLVAAIIGHAGRRPPGSTGNGEGERPSAPSAPTPDRQAAPAPSRRRSWPFTIWLHLLLIAIGSLIIIGNAPRSLEESGLIPTVVTAGIFFVPLILLPAVCIRRSIRSRRPQA